MANFKAIAGLGNPGRQYERTRHNIGFMFLDRLVAASAGANTARWQERSGAQCLEVLVGRDKLLLIKPLTYMNRSGEPLAAIMQYFKIGTGELVVAHDDIDLPFGTLRIKAGGGDGGHNGLKSISAMLQTVDYARLRFGVGRPAPELEASIEVSDWVLMPFAKDEANMLPGFLERGIGATEELLKSTLTAAQNKFN